MRIGLALPAMLHGLDRRLVLDWARRIEADGYSSVGFGERIAYRNLEMFSVLSAAAAVTERVDIAASVVVLPMHSEVWVAKQMATLDVISGVVARKRWLGRHSRRRE
jgi:alkanesulfonate monooxygenase SsuD/methylene tetrahydromethanopterin reductase-like flavin-dependent oxidoreductase (luciferase family)